MKKYKVGMYGGKFMPLHLGHKFCIETAAKECETVYAILFYGGSEEYEILERDSSKYLTVKYRMKQLKSACKELSKYGNVIPILIDVSNCKNKDGSEDWDAETPLVRKIVGNKLDAAYSSEESYGDYFKRAYPEAVHRLVDPPRKSYPISGTMIRNFNDEKEKKTWMV